MTSRSALDEHEQGSGDGYHGCPIETCRRRIPTSKLLCLIHWRMVPGAIRTRVWASYLHLEDPDYMPCRAEAIAVVHHKLGLRPSASEAPS